MHADALVEPVETLVFPLEPRTMSYKIPTCHRLTSSIFHSLDVSSEDG